MKNQLLLLLLCLIGLETMAQQTAGFPRRNMLTYTILPGAMPNSFLLGSHRFFLSAATEQPWDTIANPGISNTFINFEHLTGQKDRQMQIAWGAHALIQQTDPIQRIGLYPRITFRKKLGRHLRDFGLSIGIQSGVIRRTVKRSTFNPFHTGDKVLLNTKRNRLKGTLGVGVSAHKRIRFSLFKLKKTKDQRDILSGGMAFSQLASFNLFERREQEASLKEVLHYYTYFNYTAQGNNRNFLQINLLYGKAQQSIPHYYWGFRYHHWINPTWTGWIGGGLIHNRPFPGWNLELGVITDRKELYKVGIGWEQLHLEIGPPISSINLNLVISWREKKRYN